MKGKISGRSFSLERHPLRCPNDFTKESGEWGVTSQQAELVMGRGYHMLSRLVTRQFLKFCNDKIGLCPARHRDYTTANKEESENCWIEDVFLVKLAKLVTGLFLLRYTITNLHQK